MLSLSKSTPKRIASSKAASSQKVSGPPATKVSRGRTSLVTVPAQEVEYKPVPSTSGLSTPGFIMLNTGPSDNFNKESVERFRKEDTHNAVNNGTNVKEIFDCIQNNSPKNGIEDISRTFEEIDFIFLPKLLLKVYERRSVDRIQTLVRSFENVSVNSIALSRLLRDYGLLTEIDVQDIDTECFNRNEQAALVILIDRVTVCEEDGLIDKLKTCLREADLETVASRLDDCLMSDELENDQHDSVEIQSRKLTTEIFRDLIFENVTHSDVLGNIGTVLSRDLGWMNIVLEGDCRIGQNIETDQWKSLIDPFEGKLSTKIQPRENLDWLSQEYLLSIHDREAVEQLKMNRGSKQAVLKLLQCLPKLHTNDWYPKFMEIPLNFYHKKLVLEIDPAESKRLIKAVCIEEEEDDDVLHTCGKTDIDECVLESKVLGLLSLLFLSIYTIAVFFFIAYFM